MNPTRRIGLFTLYVLVALLAVLALGGCAAATVQTEEANSPEAQQLAQQLSDTLTAMGVTPPATAILAALYGTDGGVSCVALQDGGTQAILGLTYNGDTSGRRRASVSDEVLAFDQAVVQTYCPAQLQTFQDMVTSLGLTVPVAAAPAPAAEATPESTPSS